MSDLGSWIDAQLKARRWSRRELARRIDLTHAAVNYVVRGMNRATPDFCQRLADAFDVPVAEVFRQAGLLPDAEPETKQAEELLHIFQRLEGSERETVLAMMRGLARR